jgi:hypothetical protein
VCVDEVAVPVATVAGWVHPVRAEWSDQRWWNEVQAAVCVPAGLAVLQVGTLAA